MHLYYLEMLGIAVFAVTGVLAVIRDEPDVVGCLFLGVVTAIGGGTLRDIITDQPVFWLKDFNYVWVASATSVLVYFLSFKIRKFTKPFLYFDAFGVALFSIVATSKSLKILYSPPIAILMGLITAIGGGIIRDILAGRKNLLMTRDIYATPIFFGCLIYAVLKYYYPDIRYASLIGMIFIALGRSIVIYWNLQIPIKKLESDESEL